MWMRTSILVAYALSFFIFAIDVGGIYAGPFFIPKGNPKIKIKPNVGGYQLNLYDRDGKLLQSFQSKAFASKPKYQASQAFNKLLERARKEQGVYMLPSPQGKEGDGKATPAEILRVEPNKTRGENQASEAPTADNANPAEEVIASLSGITAACAADAKLSTDTNICDELVNEIEEAVANFSTTLQGQ